MTYVRNTRYVDKYYWVWLIFKKRILLRKDTAFENYRIPTRKVLQIFYKYIKAVSFENIAYELDLRSACVSSYAALARDALCWDFIGNHERIGGIYQDGSSKIMEINESLFFKRKYNRGKLVEEEWWIGGIKRGTRKVFILPVPNRGQPQQQLVLLLKMCSRVLLLLQTSGVLIKRSS